MIPRLTRANLTRPPADFFDSAAYVSRFEQQGFSREEAEGIVDALEMIVNESMANMQANLVTRADHYKVRRETRSFVRLILAAAAAEPC